jgi:hypothetical protein
MRYEIDYDFTIRRTFALNSVSAKEVFDLVVVVDDTIVHQCDGIPITYVGMSIRVVLLTMRRPSRMSDADVTLREHVLLHLQEVKCRRILLGSFLVHPELIVWVDTANASRVITAVLKAGQAVEQERERIGLGQDCCDAAHFRLMDGDI